MSMKIEQYLLMKLAEECAEVAQIAMKCIAFGLEETQPGGSQTNAERLYAELNDVLAQIQMLNVKEIPGFNFIPDEAAQQAKIAKVWHYHRYAATLGNVQG